MEACRDVIRKNNLTSAYIRPLVFVGDVGDGREPASRLYHRCDHCCVPVGVAYLGA